ncbi:MAG: zinc ABC transporter substrate-binding protein [Chloroflexia bacterium]|nr:zinc ABC transporter substrate-binding protein [Chloroflexia bacterium]
MSLFPHVTFAWSASRLLAAPVIVALILAGLPGAAPASAQESDPLRVVATFSILGDWVANVGGDRVEVVTIVPAGGDAHTFDPNPEQVASVADADLIVEIGAGFEPWLDDMVAASGSGATRVVVSDGLDLIGGADEHEEEASPDAAHEHADKASPEAAHTDHSDEAEDDQGHEHEPGEVDPHIWHDVTNAIASVETIRTALESADAANAATYDANASAYTAELSELDAFIRNETTQLPEDRRKLVTTHDTFGYFARAYGFEIVGTALNSLTTGSDDPPAQQIAALVGEIEASGVPAIFAENVSNTDLMESIADEAGVTLAPSLYTDALGEPGSDGETYVSMMRFNVTTIVTALAA